MKVLLVIPNLDAGGAERVVSILANNWIQNNIDVEIILLAGGTPFYKLDPRIQITNFDYRINSSGVKKILSLIKLTINFRRYLMNEKPEFVLSFMNKYNIFVLLSLWKSKIPTIVSERDSPTENIPRLRAFLRDYTYNLAKGVICQTELSKKFIIHNTGNTNVISISNPIKKVKENKLKIRQNIILNVGRLVTKKGQRYLIQAFSKLDNKDWKLVFLGDGPLKTELMDYTEDLGIKNQVIFNGTTKNVNEWYAKASVFAFPSILEGFPNALAEAMCHGLACVSFDCSTGPSELIVNGENGFLIQEKNVTQLVDKLQILIDDKELREEFSSNAFKLNNVLDQNIISSEYYEFCKRSSVL